MLSWKCQFFPLWTSWKWKQVFEVWRACSNVLHSLSPELFFLLPFPLFFSEFSPPQGLSSLLSVFFSLHHLTVKLLITTSSAVLFVQHFFWFFPPFPLPFMGSDHSCTGWPQLHRGFSASCMWPAWVSFLCAPSAPKAPLVPLRQLVWLLHFWTVLPFPAPLHTLDADQLLLPPPPYQPVTWRLPSLSLCTALLQFQPCLFHTKFCTFLFYGCSSSKLTAHFPPCLPLISDIFVNKFWWHYFL